MKRIKRVFKYKKSLIIILTLIFAFFLYYNFKEENTYNSYLKNIYYNFLGIFNKNHTLEVSYTNEQIENQELKSTIKELQKLLDIKTVLTDYEITNASVISRSLASWFDTIVIDKGSRDGIEEGMCVTNSTALVGTVIEVMEDNSVVRLITNSQNKVSAKIIGDETIYGIIYEYKDNYLILKGLKNTNVELDSEVVTTGMSYIYPAGIYIGKVIDVTYDEYGLTPIVKIKTPVDFNNILYVSVLNR